MAQYMKEKLEEALRAIASIINRSEKAQGKFAEGTSQHTLQKNRIKALYIASSSIRKELDESDATYYFTKEELETALTPIASLISKSEKAKEKLNPDSWQHKMLGENLKALYIASELLNRNLK